MLLTSLQWLVLLLALAPFVYYLVCIYCIYAFFSKNARPPSPGAFAPPISILKPVRGVDREAYENFASFCRQDYPEYEVLFAVADVDDPAIRIIVRLIRNFPERSIRLLVGAPPLGANSKVNKLCRLVREAKYDLLVMNDSDVRVDSNYLRDVAAPFAKPEVGGVTTFYRGMAEGSIAAKLEGLALATETVPNALVARQMEGKVQFAFGWTMATTKQHLAQIGGFEAMANHHSDDFELGNRIAAQGLRIEFVRHPIWMVFPKETIREYLRHELRWAIGLRNVRPAGIYGAAVGSDVGRRRLGAWRSVNAEKPLAGTPPGRVEFCRLDDGVLLKQDQVARAGFPGKERAADSAGGHENGTDLKLPGGCVPSAQEGSLRDARPCS